MADTNEWRPKVGERVAIYGEVVEDSDSQEASFTVRFEGDTPDIYYFRLDELSPLPASPEPRKPWEVLREAAPILVQFGCNASMVFRYADKLEAAAAPKPPTLAEAVRAYLDDPCDGFAHRSLMEALARAEAGQ